MKPKPQTTVQGYSPRIANYKLNVSDRLKQERLTQVERHFNQMERIRLLGEVREVVTEEEEDFEVVLEEEVVIEEGLGEQVIGDSEGTIINIGVIGSSLEEISEGKKRGGETVMGKIESKRRKRLKKENQSKKGWES